MLYVAICRNANVLDSIAPRIGGAYNGNKKIRQKKLIEWSSIEYWIACYTFRSQISKNNNNCKLLIDINCRPRFKQYLWLNRYLVGHFLDLYSAYALLSTTCCD